MLGRITYYGIASILVVYLTDELHQGTITGANNVTNWVGTVWVTPILGACIADAFLGRYWTLVVASAIYLSGMSVLTLAVSVPGLKPPCCTEANPADCKKASTLQLAVFYGALYTLAVGTGGTRPNISTMGADQFDVSEPKEKAHKLSFFNSWIYANSFGTLFAALFHVYTPRVSWTLGYGLPTIGLAISIVILLAGTPFYRHKVPSEGPFIRIAQVTAVALRKWRVPIPSDPRDELASEEYNNKRKFRIDSTPSLRSNQYVDSSMKTVAKIAKVLVFLVVTLLILTSKTLVATARPLDGPTVNVRDPARVKPESRTRIPPSRTSPIHHGNYPAPPARP